MYIYKLEGGQNHSWSSKIGIWGIFREKGLIREIEHRIYYGLGWAIHV
jgi:hypothetical protein